MHFKKMTLASVGRTEWRRHGHSKASAKVQVSEASGLDKGGGGKISKTGSNSANVTCLNFRKKHSSIGIRG